MKKILLILSLALLINCSLDTFNSDNLASWSINFDLPLFKSTYTIRELLKDYKELEVEQYNNTSDSIYVFNASTIHAIEVEFTITKDGDDVNPEVVQVDPYELDIPTLPEELDGVNFADIDLFLDVDLTQFNTALADSVVIDHLTITGTNDDNETETASVNNQNIMINGTVEVEDPEALINIRPTTVVVEGQITVYPTDAAGESFNEGEPIILVSRLHAPLVLEITETSTFSGTPSKMDGLSDEDLFEKLFLYVDIDNQFELGGELKLLVSPDTLNFEEGSTTLPDTLFTLDLLPEEHLEKTIEISDEKISLFADSTYVKISMALTGRADGGYTHLFTDDYLEILLYSSAELLIDPQNMGEED